MHSCIYFLYVNYLMQGANLHQEQFDLIYLLSVISPNIVYILNLMHFSTKLIWIFKLFKFQNVFLSFESFEYHKQCLTSRNIWNICNLFTLVLLSSNKQVPILILFLVKSLSRLSHFYSLTHSGFMYLEAQ
jgi:hypothetical protein